MSMVWGPGPPRTLQSTARARPRLSNTVTRALPRPRWPPSGAEGWLQKARLPALGNLFTLKRSFSEVKPVDARLSNQDARSPDERIRDRLPRLEDRSCRLLRRHGQLRCHCAVHLWALPQAARGQLRLAPRGDIRR